MMLVGWLGGKEQLGACDKAAELGQRALQYLQHIRVSLNSAEDVAEDGCDAPAYQNRGTNHDV